MIQERNGGITLSKTFCPLPWTHLATHPHGAVTLCCESDMTNRASDSQNANKDYQTFHTTEYDLNRIMNSDLFKEVRMQMLNGEEPSVCSKCYKYESMGNGSKRTIELERLDYSLEDAIIDTNFDGHIDHTNFEFIELRLGNHCNLACRSCNPFSSTKWIKDWEKLHGGTPIKQNLFNWPLDEKFWDSLKKHCKKIKHLYINGGEPLLIDKHKHFLQFLVDNGYAENIELTYSTNSTIIDESYVDIWREFKYVDFLLSIDDIQERNEYLRYPSNWDKTIEALKWFSNLYKYEDRGEHRLRSRIMQTVSIMNIYYVKEAQDFFKKLNLRVDHNFVHDPRHYNAVNLPPYAKQKVLDKLVNTPLHSRFQNFLNIDNNPSYFNEFFEVNNKLDEIRKESFKHVFEEWHEILRGKNDY